MKKMQAHQLFETETFRPNIDHQATQPKDYSKQQSCCNWLAEGLILTTKLFEVNVY